MQQRIANQVTLPVRVALDVVFQGIRIRFGRSLVTLSGVALGVAFLMSIFTGQIIKKGVGQEETLRNETGRMYGFLTAEIGPVTDRVMDVVQVGPLNEMERRLVGKMRDKRVARIRWAALGAATPPASIGSVDPPAAASGDGAAGVIVMGESPGGDAWRAATADSSAPVMVTRRDLVPTALSSMPCLQRKLRPEEVAAAEEATRRATFRSGWIITISLLVTVIGISNAMLMSVTERFREIGTMKCLGALSGFIRRIFLIESSLIGVAGSVAGALFGMVFSMCAYGLTYGFGMVLGSMAWLTLLMYWTVSVVIGLTLAVLAALYPAQFASRMVPAAALRSNI